jgi:methionyl-tRNA formyltransferase
MNSKLKNYQQQNSLGLDQPYIVASSKSWNKSLPHRLSEVTGRKFQLISDPKELTIKYLAELNPRYIFFPHWSDLIPAEVFQKFECVIFHMTDLPFGRGGSPLQNLISRGIYETQISALQCEEDVDAGPIYFKHPLSLYGSAEEVYLRASEVIEKMITEIVEQNPVPIAQVGEPIFFRRRRPDQGNLLEAKSLNKIFDLIRMLDADGYPSAFINIGNLRLEFRRASRTADNIIADVRISLNDKNIEEPK